MILHKPTKEFNLKNKHYHFLRLGNLRLQGRNKGRISSYHRGGGSKRSFYIINYLRPLWYLWAVVLQFVYTPKRNNPIMLVYTTNNCLFYELLPKSIKVGSIIKYGRFNDLEQKSTINIIGYHNYLINLDAGCYVHMLQFSSNKKSWFGRSGGTTIKLLAHIPVKCQTLLKLSKIQTIQVSQFCLVTTGKLDTNEFFCSYTNKYKTAGFCRRKGKRPVVRGVAMNPIDHPHGGGQGKTSGGRVSVSPWGWLTKGKKTKQLKKRNFFIFINATR